jgi:hypothetical protein
LLLLFGLAEVGIDANVVLALIFAKVKDFKVLVAAGEGAILAGQAEPHRECSMAVSGDSVAW